VKTSSLRRSPNGLKRQSKKARAKLPPLPKGARCVIHSPRCTGSAQGWHHKLKRRFNVHTKESLVPACNGCNGYIEDHPKWAAANGHTVNEKYHGHEAVEKLRRAS
jgi:hypothetical protein